jgi:hypothetical protein
MVDSSSGFQRLLAKFMINEITNSKPCHLCCLFLLLVCFTLACLFPLSFGTNAYTISPQIFHPSKL